MKKNKVKILICIVIIVGLYLLFSLYYTRHFFMNTYIGNYDVSNLTVLDANNMLLEDITSNYSLSIQDNSNVNYLINGKDIDLSLEIELNDKIEKQTSWKWLFKSFKRKDYPLEYKVIFDEAKLEERINFVNMFDETSMVEPTNAYISDYIIGEGYKIIEETEGNYLLKDKTIKEIKDSVYNLENRIDLKEKDCYKKPEITKDSEELKKELERKNKTISAVITYDLENKEIVLNADTYHTWLIDDGENISINEDLAAEYVANLIKETDTAYTQREFKTTSGRVVNVTGPYGYRIAKNDERTQLINDILSGENIKRKPTYVREGATRNGNDYGNTYVEIDLTNQKVYLYVNGELIQSSDCVTGNVSKGYTTPPGIFPLTYKQKNAVLRGPGYASPVDFWMPFNGGIGLHDASWRGSFGGKIYKTNGSHGCINLPRSMAKTLYDNVYAGMPIICYN